MATWGRKPTCICGDCKKCKHAEYMRNRYRAQTMEERRRERATRDPERVREYDRQRYHTKRRTDPEEMRRRLARSAATWAIRSGRLTKEPCESCGHDPAQAHHDDYDKPLEVRWLCTVCHAQAHAQQKAA